MFRHIFSIARVPFRSVSRQAFRTGLLVMFVGAAVASRAQGPSTSSKAATNQGTASTAVTKQGSPGPPQATGHPEAAAPDWMDRLIQNSEEVQHVDAPGTPPHEHPGMEPAAPHQHDMSNMSGDMSTMPGMEGMNHGAMSAEEMAQHDHGAMPSVPDSWFVQLLLAITLALSGMLVIFACRGLQPARQTATLLGRDLLKVPLLGGFLRWRHFNTVLLAPTLLIFAFIVLAGLFGEQATSNPAILLTWILWWPAVIFTFFLVGRIWCTICPFGYLGDVAQKVASLRKKAPRILKNMWWRLGLFLALTWVTTLFALDKVPRSTAYLALALTGGAVVLAVIYEKRVFCRYVCPVGGIFGLYSMTAPVHLSVKDKHICQTECQGKDCNAACDWFQFPAAMERGAECNLCLDCVRACPHDNFALNAQPFAADLVQFQPHRKSLDEAATVAAILGVSLLQTVVMLNAWQGWQADVAAMLHIPAGPVLYTVIFVVFGLALPLLLVGFITFLSTRGQTVRPDVFSALRTYAYAFLPLGLGLHAAHNFHHLFGEGGALWQGVKASVARYTGWGAAAAQAMEPAKPMNSDALFLLQWLALMGGLYLAYRVSTRLVARQASGQKGAFRMALPILVFAVAYTILNVLVLAAPMAHRH
jgi:ferredoxin